jgi:dihydroorotase
VRIRVAGGHLIDPANGVDRDADIFLAEGRVVAIGQAPADFREDLNIDATGKLICPGFVDVCARLREPGAEHKADIASETRAAVASGITTLCVPPDTDPVIDEPAIVELIRTRNVAAGELCRIVTVGALTRGLGGTLLSEMAALREAGCVAVGNAMQPVENTLVLRRALEYAATYDLTVFIAPRDPWLSQGGCAHEGAVATRLGLPAISAAAETAALARDLALVEEVGVRAHFGRISTARGVELLEEAINRGLQISADTAAHQLHLCDTALIGFDANCRVDPPLRAATDRDALRRAVGKGTLSAVCSDHQPHDADAKEQPFCAVEPGISGLETLMPLVLSLVADGLPIAVAIERLTAGPARVLGLDAGHLGMGAAGDLCVIDLGARYTLGATQMLSRGRNSPFIDQTLEGRVEWTLLQGRVVHAPAADETRVT